MAGGEGTEDRAARVRPCLPLPPVATTKVARSGGTEHGTTPVTAPSERHGGEIGVDERCQN